MDPIHPVSPRPPAVLPVSDSRVKRVVRDPRKDSRDTPKDRFTAGEEPSSGEDRTRKQAPGEPPEPPPLGEPSAVDDDEQGPRHIDVRA